MLKLQEIEQIFQELGLTAKQEYALFDNWEMLEKLAMLETESGIDEPILIRYAATTSREEDVVGGKLE